jgi:hypothetical protein
VVLPTGAHFIWDCELDMEPGQESVGNSSCTGDEQMRTLLHCVIGD